MRKAELLLGVSGECPGSGDAPSRDETLGDDAVACNTGEASSKVNGDARFTEDASAAISVSTENENAADFAGSAVASCLAA